MIDEIIITTLASSGIIGGTGYFLRDWLAIRLTKGIQHEYDGKLAQLKSDLKRKEEEITSLRSSVLTTAMNSHQYVEERKIKAIDDLWSGFMDIQKLTGAVHMISPLNLDELGKSLNDKKTKDFINTLVKPLNIDPKNWDIEQSIKGRSSRPWVPPHIWDTYQAYNSVTMQAVMYLNTFNIGIDPRAFLKKDSFDDILKKALPEVSIDWKNLTHTAWPTLLTLLETKLYIEIQKEISGKNSDDKALERMKHIKEQIERLDEEDKKK